MRLSTQQFYIQNLDNVNQSNARLFKVQQQLATGQKLSQPSDDPLAATQINKYERVIARNEVFANNVNVSERRLRLEESTLTAITESVLNIKDLAIQANNGANSDNDRAIIGEEMRQILGQLVGALNTRDAQGEYLFSGFKGGTEPYQLNADDNYEYRGDSGQRFLDIGENATIAATDPGSTLFGSGEDNLLNVVNSLASLLKGDRPLDAAFETITEEVSDLQGQVDQFFETLVTKRSELGARLRVLDDQRDALADIKLFTQNTLSKFKDTDYYEATSQLLLEQNALQAAYASFGKIQQLSLFNYVN
ncbi:flagellar hook-associated protein FlgL [Nitrincola alkalilacustris]|uniref:flagellar hook-associated protein FlgL n=1 Tax=Nitrincola alkalilacustris TaxID=1571224 RepID=UPI00124BFED8|nr:flagellar hook-associated protein FlgL [Nitrincola alkalilacustris]